MHQVAFPDTLPSGKISRGIFSLLACCHDYEFGYDTSSVCASVCLCLCVCERERLSKYMCIFFKILKHVFT